MTQPALFLDQACNSSNRYAPKSSSEGAGFWLDGELNTRPIGATRPVVVETCAFGATSPLGSILSRVSFAPEVVYLALAGSVVIMLTDDQLKSPFQLNASYRYPSHTVFEEFDKAKLDTSAFEAELFDLRTSADIPFRDRLADRLTHLLADFKLDYEAGLDPLSLRTMVNFLASNKWLRLPSTTATPKGWLFGEWRNKERTKYLGIHFLPNGQCKYVAIRPNPEHAHLQIRVSGQATPSLLIQELSSYAVPQWASEQA